MNVKLYNAAVMRLRAEAMEALALIDVLLTNPTAVPDHGSIVEEIMVQSRRLAEYEGAMLTLQQYFGAQPQAPAMPAPPPPPPRTEPITEEELLERSPTFRQSAAGQQALSEEE